MLRYALLLVAAVLASPALADPPPPPVPPVPPIPPGVPVPPHLAGAGGFRVVEAKVEQDRLTWTQTVTVPVTKNVPVTVEVDGMKVTQNRAVTVLETASIAMGAELKSVKATDAAGKALDAKKLAELLKESTPVVLGAVPEKHRKLFKDTTVFIESYRPEPPKGGPAPFPPPPPPPKVDPAPPVEK